MRWNNRESERMRKKIPTPGCYKVQRERKREREEVKRMEEKKFMLVLST